jgi:AGCS family alanine or glycine:cation symporter
MDTVMHLLDQINSILWHDSVLFTLIGVGVLFTAWTALGQYRAVTHGVQVIRGVYDKKDDPGAINHFQALSAALSATVGLGNIGGVAIAIALGGPGAVFWMWVVGLLGMAIKMTEVTQSMLWRNTDDPDNPHGGPMWVVSRGLAKFHPALKPLGIFIGGIFCLTLLVSTVTGGNMFQSWNVGELTEMYFGVPPLVTGIVLAVVVGMVIVGGIKRIGAVAGRLVPFMCVLYLIMGIIVILMQVDRVPEAFGMIFRGAFSPFEAQNAFIGGTAGYAFLFGMKRALFSNEAGQGSAPIAHSAAKTGEPVREGVVAGLGPLIDTLIVCTITAMVIITSGAWSRGPDTTFQQTSIEITRGAEGWTVTTPDLPKEGGWREGDKKVFCVLGEQDALGKRVRLTGNVTLEDGNWAVDWNEAGGDMFSGPPMVIDGGVYADLPGASLTSHAFDRIIPSSGRWMVTLAAWLFAISTMISWSYYGEQGVVFLFGNRGVLPYKVLYCLLAVVATMGFISTDAALDALTSFGTGVMLFANIPIMLIFGYAAMKAYHAYMGRLRRGEFHPHKTPSVEDVVSGRDVE